MLLSIIVLNYNRVEYSKKTIVNLIKMTTVPHEFIFVDNHSSDGTKQYLKSIAKRTNAKRELLVLNRYNYGVAGGRNAGIVNAKGDYIMTIDNDILVPPKYDVDIINALKNIPKLGIVGISVEKPDYPILKKNGVEIQVKDGNIGGACMCFPRKTIEKVGYFSTDFKYGGEDCDMYLRINHINLINGYVLSKGIHLDNRKNEYKIKSHSFGSKHMLKHRKNMKKYIKQKSVYVPYSIPFKFNKDGSKKW